MIINYQETCFTRNYGIYKKEDQENRYDLDLLQIKIKFISKKRKQKPKKPTMSRAKSERIMEMKPSFNSKTLPGLPLEMNKLKSDMVKRRESALLNVSIRICKLSKLFNR